MTHALKDVAAHGSPQNLRTLAVISSHAFSLVHFRGALIRELVANGWVVYALAPDFDDNLRARTIDLGARPLDSSLVRTGMNPVRDMLDAAALFRRLKVLAPHVTLGFFVKPVIYGSIAAWLAGVPRRFSMIEGLGYVFMDDAASHTAHRRLLRYLVSRLYKLALRLNEKVFFLNRDDVAQFLGAKLLDERRVVHIDGIGLDLEYYRPAPPVLQPVTFLLIGRMLKEKGIYDYIAAAVILRRRFQNLRFLLVGATDPNPGSIRESEVCHWVATGLVEWPGQVDDVRPWIEQASVLVLPSYREGMPRSTQEAMAMGRAIITTDVPGCRETVVDGVNGYLVPVRDPAALAQAMQRFIEARHLIAIMGREGQRMARERFDVHRINARVLGVIEA